MVMGMNMCRKQAKKVPSVNTLQESCSKMHQTWRTCLVPGPYDLTHTAAQ